MLKSTRVFSSWAHSWGSSWTNEKYEGVHKLIQKTTQENNDYLCDSRVNVWDTHAHTKHSTSFSIYSWCQLASPLLPFYSHFLHAPSVFPNPHLFSQFLWIQATNTTVLINRGPADIIFPTKSLACIPPNPTSLCVFHSIFIQLFSLCHSLSILWPWSVFWMEKKAAKKTTRGERAGGKKWLEEWKTWGRNEKRELWA